MRAMVFGSLVTLAAASMLGQPTGIGPVSVSEAFFNPSLGQKEAIEVPITRAGRLSAQILDRDGYLVRRLVEGRPVDAEVLWLEWDGRDDGGSIVPNEAYSLKIDLRGPDFSSTYFPGSEAPHDVPVELIGYDRLTGVLSYRLAAPARVHAQAGVSRLDPRSKEHDGPVMKTLVNREPRPGGAVIENWGGFDETGRINVSDLPDFVVAVAASSLPANALITSGNDGAQFSARVTHRKGQSLFPPNGSAEHGHHRGLATLDDTSPELRVLATNATWQESDGVWVASDRHLSGVVTLEGPSAPYFAKQPGELLLFVAGRRVSSLSRPTNGGAFEIDVGHLPPGDHIVAVNWASRFGPVAVAAMRVRIPPSTTSKASAAGGGR